MNLEEKQNRNIKLFPIYKMFAWDLLFYYAISFLFFTEAKGMTVSDILLVEVSLYTFFKAVFQVPAIMFIDRYGKRNCLVFANILICISLLLIIISTNITFFIVAHIIMALGYVLKSLIESNLLFDSIPDSETKRKKFSKLDSRGSSFYYCLNAVSSVATGFLYLVNPYLPIIVCLMLTVFATAVSTFFTDTVREETQKETVSKPSESAAAYLKELKYIFKYIVKSGRLRSLIIFYGLFQSLIAVVNTLDKSLLNDLGVSARIFRNRFCHSFTTCRYFVFFAKLFTQEV